MEYCSFSPVDIRFLSLKNLITMLADDVEPALVLASAGTVQRVNSAKFSEFISRPNCLHIADIPVNPSIDALRSVLNRLSGRDPFRRIVAVGGGSCIDLAKAVSALSWMSLECSLENTDVREAIHKKNYFKSGSVADIITVPTTSGTGSEVTKWATIWDTEKSAKLSVDHSGCFPKMALLVPDLCTYMPSTVTLSTGLDALSHAMEAFWAVRRTPLSQMLSIAAVDRIRKYLPLVLKDQKNVLLRQEMCLASLMAGLAFSITRTAACHSISYPLTLLHNVPHGFAASVTLGEVMNINEAVISEMHELYGLFGGYEGFISWMDSVSQNIQRMRLSAFGICKSDIAQIAAGAFTTGRMDNNPVVLTEEQVAALLLRIL